MSSLRQAKNLGWLFGPRETSKYSTYTGSENNMAGPLWPGYYDFNKVQPFDLQLFRHVIFNENGKCSPRNLVRTFYQFRNENDVVQWIRNLPNTYGRQLLEVTKTGMETTVSISLNGVDVCKKYGYSGNCKQGCKRLHVCLYFLKGHCKRGRKMSTVSRCF